jgi:hypothetical protein
VSCEDQGQQEHEWFCHGIAPPKGKPPLTSSDPLKSVHPPCLLSTGFPACRLGVLASTPSKLDARQPVYDR